MIILAKLGVLEVSFLILLLFMLGLSGLIAMAVITRMVEPRGMKHLGQKLTGLGSKDEK